MSSIQLVEGELELEPVGLALEPLRSVGGGGEPKGEGDGEGKVGKRIREKEKLLTVA